MPVSTGIKVQQSRFAVLKVEDAVESDSGEEEEGGEWRQVGRGGSGSKAGRSPPKQREAQAGAGGSSKTAAKNAKRRARKRQSRQSTSSEVSQSVCGFTSYMYIVCVVIQYALLLTILQTEVQGSVGEPVPEPEPEPGGEHDPQWEHWQHSDKEAMDKIFIRNMEVSLDYFLFVVCQGGTV